MISKEIIKRIIVESQDVAANVDLTPRPISYEPKSCYVIVGLRQAGKSYLLYQRFQQLLAEGCNKHKLVYVNFDDERLQQLQSEELGTILDAYSELYDDGRPVLFFDEIQNVEGWEHFARRLANQKYEVYITGSNAKMLSRDIATTLGGRYWVKNVCTYSFGEYLNALGINLERNWQYGTMAIVVARAFSDYFYFGGFPEIVNTKAKRAWLNNIYNKIFLNDIVVRNGVRSEEALRMTVNRLAQCVCQPVSFNRLANLIKATGVNISTSTVIDYVRYLADACLVHSLSNYASRFVERESIKKYYFADNGLLNIFLIGNEALLLENLCARKLHRLWGNDVWFYKHNVEVDFFVPSEGIAVQACYSLSDPSTEKRETTALLALDALLGKQEQPSLKQMIIVTHDEERTIVTPGGKNIEVVPAWKWLLQE